MQAGIMQPYFLPYIGYFQLINQVDLFLLYGQVSFRKKSWITRNRLKEKSNGSAYFCSVPVKKQSSSKSIHAIEIDNSAVWQRALLARIESDYRGATYFEETYPVLKNILTFKTDKLIALNNYSVKLLAAHLGINATILDSQDTHFDDLETQLLSRPHEDTDTRSARVLALCKHLNCNGYVNPPGGTELYDKALFLSKGVTLSFMQPTTYVYDQFSTPFMANLSIVDALMHTGRLACKMHLDKASAV